MVQDLEEALARRSNGIGTLDGGQATHLETLGFDLSSPLWSASLLARKDDPAAHDAITRVHRDFIDAGADIIGTMTYQLSDLAWEKAHDGSSPPEGEVARLMAEALRLAAEARASSSRPQTLISLSLGPYGAALANGAEYTGDYLLDVNMVDFHARRLRQAMSSPHFSSDIDLIAFETIPRLDEAQAVLDALDLVAREAPTATMPPAYLSFVFEASGKLPGGQDGGEEVLSLLAKHRGRWPVVGMGINCTKMPILEKVVRDLAGDKGLHLFLYPDGGLTWDGIAREWRGTTSTDGWAQSLAQLAKEAKPQWKGVWVGGCCKVGPEEIQKLGELV